LRWAPFLGGFLSLSGAVLVDRKDKTRAIDSLQTAGSFLKTNNSSLWLFPEGTRSMRPHHDLLPFKKGAFHAAIQAGIPIIPVVCGNQWKLYRKGVFESGVLKIRGIYIRVKSISIVLLKSLKVLSPIPTATLAPADVTELSIQTRELMIAALREISTPVADSVDTQSPPPAKEVQDTIQSSDHITHRDQPSQIDTKSGPDSAESTSATPEGSVISSRIEGSENGIETEEDEGMVLVGRPERA
jgi:lysophosphatidate acyltransferase